MIALHAMLVENTRASTINLTNAQRMMGRLGVKLRPNDRNISTQHIPTLLAQHLQAPVKRSQHFSTTYRSTVGRNMLHAFTTLLLPHVPTC